MPSGRRVHGAGLVLVENLANDVNQFLMIIASLRIVGGCGTFDGKSALAPYFLLHLNHEHLAAGLGGLGGIRDPFHRLKLCDVTEFRFDVVDHILRIA